MKNNSSVCFLFLFCSMRSLNLAGQCTSAATLGTSSNMLTKAQYNANTVVVDKDLNTVVFIHRNHPAVFGGSSGHLRYDISMDAGTTWTNNLGTLNPILTKQARYPNVAIHNPANNTDPNNAYISFLAPTINSNGSWSGLVAGAQKADGTGNSESYIQPATTNFISGSFIKGAPGIFWASDFAYSNAQFNGNILIYKGVWNSTTNTISWGLNQTLNVGYNTSFSGNPALGESCIAFDPTGQKGWLCVTTHPNSSSGAYRYQPVFYQTDNGGASWFGPTVVDLAQFSCITGGLGTNIVPGVHYANDLTVDIYGQPHMIVTVGASDNTYGIYSNQWHHVIDVTQQHGVWTAYDLANVKAEVATLFPGSQGSDLNQIMHPQAARSADGTKIFFSWIDNQFYNLGFPNMIPELYAKGFDVVQNKWTNVKDFTGCSPSATGQIFFPHMAAEVLEPAAGDYKLAVVYADFLGDPDDPADFRFLDNAIFSNSDFTNSQSFLNPLTVSPLGTTAICPGTSATLQVSGSYQDIQWSNGYWGSPISVSTAGIYHVGVRQGCFVGWDSLTVQTLSLSFPSTSLNVCKGVTQTLTVNGAANGYTWIPGPLVGASVTVTPASDMVYTVTGVGIGTCVATKTINVVANPLPTVTINSSHSLICAGEEVILEASGAVTYSWSSGASTSTTAVTPALNNFYLVTGYDALNCPGTFTFTQMVDACTGLSDVEREKNDLHVYPNPSAGKITIQAVRDIRCVLFNGLGQQITSIELNEENFYTLHVSNLAPGIYFLSDGAKLYQKIVVQQ